MKVRMDDSSVRLRLAKSEVDQFAESGMVETVLPFPGQELKWSLIKADTKELSCTLESNVIKVLVPHSTAEQWTQTERVGFRGQVETESGALGILVEKDFKCLTGPDKENSDLYENPYAKK